MSRLMLCVVKRCVEIFAILKTALRVPGLNLGSVVIYRWWSKCGPSMSKCKISLFSGLSEPKTPNSSNTTNPKPTPSTDVKDSERGKGSHLTTFLIWKPNSIKHGVAQRAMQHLIQIANETMA